MRPVRDVRASEPAPIIEFEAPTSLPRQGWRYTARPLWSSAGESMWMRLSKFSLCNRLGVAELAALFSLRADDGAGDAVDLRRIDRWNQDALASILEISITAVRTSFCGVVPRQVLVRSCTELRYCEPCLREGFHAAWFQWLHVERCPLHNKPLRTACLQCSAPIPTCSASTLH